MVLQVSWKKYFAQFYNILLTDVISNIISNIQEQ